MVPEFLKCAHILGMSVGRQFVTEVTLRHVISIQTTSLALHVTCNAGKNQKLFKTPVTFFEILLKCAILASLVPIVPRFNHIQWQYGLITAKSVLCPSFRKTRL